MSRQSQRRPKTKIKPKPKTEISKNSTNSALEVQETKSTKEDSSYAQKTDRIKALSQLIKSIAPFIWMVVILVVLIPLIGQFLISTSAPTENQKTTPVRQETVLVAPPPNFNQVNKEVAQAIIKAQNGAEVFAAYELDRWLDNLTPRVDNFLDWYFDYFTQKKLEFTIPFVWLGAAATHQIAEDRPLAEQAVAETLTKNFQKEFTKRVLVPKNAQIMLERLTAETVEFHVAELEKSLTQVQAKYKIPQGEWERYLNDISSTINDTEGNLSHLSLKVLVGGGGYLIAKPLILGVAGKVAAKVSAKVTGKAAAKLASKTGGAVATEFGASLLDPIVGVGVLIWDVWDYHHTVDVDRPILRQNILDYLKEVKKSLLKNPDTGIMSTIDRFDREILESLRSTKSN
ncbi:hypothetical protein [Lusitaniella coriacea]|uniref:hypothetical protein n=1 Tax=Lusitaniella coriacea TaxID=1983105 RepID=UPI003CF8C1FD